MDVGALSHHKKAAGHGGFRRLTECEAFLLRSGLKSRVLEPLPLVNVYLVCNT
jgi:hypothetical protein